MSRDEPVEALVRWRLALAEDEAPPPPRAIELLERSRPWWEREPAQFRVQAARVHRMPAALGFAMSAAATGGNGGLVPAVISATADVETYVQLLYLSAQNGRLRMRFTIDVDGLDTYRAFDTAFVSDSSESPLFTAIAELSQSGEYRLDVALPPDVANTWATLRITDHMPFRLILQAREDGSDNVKSAEIR
jgi:hypothetical protein